jgi:GntR family transcriptional regulator, rspAB operon transcriptional repressor
LAYTKLRRRIIFQDLPGGQTLDELSLARQLKIGRTPVREAMQRLAAEGLLRVVPRKGTFVTELGVDTMRQVFEARSSCEAQIARLAALRAEPSEIALMERSLADVDRLVDERRFRELLEADEKFHLALAEAAKNRLLREMLMSVYGVGVRFWYMTLPQRRSVEIKREMQLHLEVVEMIKQHDPEGAAQAVLTLIGGFPDRVSNVSHSVVRAEAS